MGGWESSCLPGQQDMSFPLSRPGRYLKQILSRAHLHGCFHNFFRAPPPVSLLIALNGSLGDVFCDMIATPLSTSNIQDLQATQTLC